MQINEWIVLIATAVSMGFIIWKFSLAVKEGSFYSGIFLGTPKEIFKRENPLQFYIGISIRIIIATLAVLASSWILYQLLQNEVQLIFYLN